MQCMGIASDRSRCGLPAGWGTDDQRFCRYHDDQQVFHLYPNVTREERIVYIVADADTVDGDISDGAYVHVQSERGIRAAFDIDLEGEGYPAEDVLMFY